MPLLIKRFDVREVSSGQKIVLEFFHLREGWAGSIEKGYEFVGMVDGVGDHVVMKVIVRNKYINLNKF